MPPGSAVRGGAELVPDAWRARQALADEFEGTGGSGGPQSSHRSASELRRRCGFTDVGARLEQVAASPGAKLVAALRRKFPRACHRIPHPYDTNSPATSDSPCCPR